MRGEAFANHNWTVTNDLTLESSLNFEFSKITNNYPFSPTAKYKFLKPRADLRYDLTDADQVRLKAERTISQLQFFNFVPSFDVVDNEIDAGNPDLKPEKALTF
ncbi:MAG: TonB-dependent receptor [Rhodospirillaceae bacterium]|nr:TonB-dependent receptor [Rhodospirillaceae bacterium]